MTEPSAELRTACEALCEEHDRNCNVCDKDLSGFRGHFAGLLADFIAAREQAAKWKCKALVGSAGLNDPQDCDYPFCGCDPSSGKVIDTLIECGWQSGDEIRKREQRVRELVEKCQREADRFDDDDGVLYRWFADELQAALAQEKP